MARKQLEIVAAQALGVATHDAAVGVALEAVRSGSNDIAFRATVGITSVGTPAANESGIVISDDAGKVRTFRDADDFVKRAGSLGMLPSSMQVTLSGLELVQPRPFTGDIIKKNQSLVASYTKRKTDATARSATYATELALYAGDPTIPPSTVAEKQAQKDSVDALVTWLQAEIDRINAILAG